MGLSSRFISKIPSEKRLKIIFNWHLFFKKLQKPTIHQLLNVFANDFGAFFWEMFKLGPQINADLGNF